MQCGCSVASSVYYYCRSCDVIARVKVSVLCLYLYTATAQDDCVLKGLVENTNALILGTCSANTECTRVDCINSPFPGLGNSSITVLPCALPKPSLNLFVIGANGDVLGNFTSYNDATNQSLLDGSTPVFSLDWVIQYNSADSSLVFQVRSPNSDHAFVPNFHKILYKHFLLVEHISVLNRYTCIFIHMHASLVPRPIFL